MNDVRAVEIFLARLYTNAEALDRFAADPAGEARRAGLLEPDVAALAAADIAGLRLAAASYARKRRAHAASRPKGR